MTSPIVPYAALHISPNGPGDARPTALQIIAADSLTDAWPHKTILITGGSSGIGVETARALHATGARIFITSRDHAKAQQVVTEILESSPSNRPIEILDMELDSLASIRAGAAAFLAKSDRLNILINNAGVMAAPKGKTIDGFETHIGVNHFSHFLLTSLLLPTLVASSTPASASRVINVASMGHWYAPVSLSDPNYDIGEYKPMHAYGRSKHANILHANEIERRYGSDVEHPVHAFSLHPGGVTTELWRHLSETRFTGEHMKGWKSVEQGAATTVWCAAAKVWEGKAGRYCEDVRESIKGRAETVEDWVPGETGYAPWAYNEIAERGLWESSLKAVGVDA